jgi:trimethylamine:corrinoid methyltransferase-like protein
MGWGQNIRNIKLTHEGISFRSFLDVKLKGSFYTSGGFEYNYQQPFSTTQQLKNLNSWQQSGLLGISKTVAVSSKFFKQTKVQLLWDFLSYRQLPRSQPLKFRIGYNLK